MRIRESIPPLAAAGTLLLAGCGGGRSATPEISTTTPQETTQGPTAAEYDAAYNKSLNDFRNRVLFKHQAEILLGSCVAWGNESGTITVTLNPGVGKVDIDGQKENYYIFSTHDPSYDPSWGPLNGPEIGSDQAMTLVFMPKILPKGGINNRHLSPKELRDKTGQTYYEDLQTEEPVMDTVLVNGPLSPSNVSAVCASLSDHTPLPGSA